MFVELPVAGVAAGVDVEGRRILPYAFPEKEARGRAIALGTKAVPAVGLVLMRAGDA